MSTMIVVKLLAAAPGTQVACLPVGLVAWDGQGKVYVDWVPDQERAAFWQGVVERCRDAGTLIPEVVEAWTDNLVNGQTVELQTSVVEVPDGRTAEEVFREMAGQTDTQWAMMTAEVQDALDGQPSLLGLFVRGGASNKGA